MAKKLSPDGLPEDVPSTLPDKNTDIFGDIKFDPDEEGGINLPEEGPTRIAHKKKEVLEPSTQLPLGTSEPRTKIVGVPRKKRAEVPPTAANSDFLSDPVVGWVVIVDGPGKGASLQLGIGQNTLGRGGRARVRIDFGDQEISRDSHTIITYDPKHNKYYAQPGLGTNIAYLEDDPILQPKLLSSGNKISLGSTTLRFIALCDDSFTWSE